VLKNARASEALIYRIFFGILLAYYFQCVLRLVRMRAIFTRN